MTAELGDPSGELGTMPLGELLVVYGNWRSRRIPAHPRRVHWSAELKLSSKMTEHRAALRAIADKTAKGQDLTPHLSDRVAVAYEPAGTRESSTHLRRDRDLMLASWGVHHLHLSTISGNRPAPFLAGTGDLLYTCFTTGDAFFIGVFDHNSWSLKEVLTIVVRNWPDAGLVLGPLPDANLDVAVSDPERARIRKAGGSLLEEIDGRVYLPPGQTLAGTPIHVSRARMRILETLRQWRDHLAANPEALDEVAGISSANPTGAPWEPRISGDEFGFEREGQFVALDRFP